MNIALRKNATGTTASKTGFAFLLVTILFFFWSLSNNLNPFLIPHLKKSLILTTAQSTFVDFAIYIACFLMALSASDAMKKFGYKVDVINCLLFVAIGSLLFVPAAYTQSYEFYLIALFVIACGLDKR